MSILCKLFGHKIKINTNCDRLCADKIAAYNNMEICFGKTDIWCKRCYESIAQTIITVDDKIHLMVKKRIHLQMKIINLYPCFLCKKLPEMKVEEICHKCSDGSLMVEHLLRWNAKMSDLWEDHKRKIEHEGEDRFRCGTHFAAEYNQNNEEYPGDECLEGGCKYCCGEDYIFKCSFCDFVSNKTKVHFTENCIAAQIYLHNLLNP